ncbi:MAG: M23 family metallopeptidase [Balneolaceae bacterium]|nr:M23 family metallopeptidase [Balneolaceae bacterium]
MNISTSRYRTIFTFSILCFLLISAKGVKAQYGQSTQRDTLTNTVLIHPVIDAESVYTAEHTYNPNLRNGDQLARDFVVAKLTDKGFTRKFKTDGSTNSDWYGWRNDVLAPITGTITRVEDPSSTNTPGTMNREAQPGLIFFEHNDVTVIYAHVREIEVEEGEHVNAGQVVAKVGNNGNSRNPHIHVGAWKGETPLQIQVDLYAEQRGQGDSTDAKE